MRLLRRSRPTRQLPEDWVQPRGSGRATTTGNLDSPSSAQVDPAGLVTIEGRTWSLDWWIGAEDRWHIPSQEVAVRQSLIGSSPVTETRVKVPSGDAVHRAYAARNQAGDEAIVVEVHNDSKVPFAVALAIRPHGQAEVGRIDEIGLDGLTVSVDGVPAVALPRSPGRMALHDGTVDSASAVLGGEAGVVEGGTVSDPDGFANGAFLFPLAHTATLRVVLPLTARPDSVALDPDDFPGANDVASGWASQASTGWRVELPDRRLRDATTASVRHLLLARRTVRGAIALDLAGFPDEAGRFLIDEALALSGTKEPGLALAAVARHWELTRDADFARAAVGLVGALVARVGRHADGGDRDTGQAAMGSVALLLAAGGETLAAADAATLAAAVPDGLSPAPLGADLATLLGSATGVWTWPGPGTNHDADANAALVAAVRAQLLAETTHGLALSPTVPETWLGQGWEVHDAPTRYGRLSFAVRWHAERPALLWELTPHDPDVEVRLTAPALDFGWSSSESSGEALLAPVAMPAKTPKRGISMPVTIESTPRRRDGG